MFLIPSSWAFSRNRYAPGSLSVQPREPLFHSGGVQLDAHRSPALDVLLELFEAGVAIARVEAGVHDELARMLLRERAIALGGVEPGRVPLLQVGRLEDRHVDVAVLEDVLHQVLLGVLLEVLDGPMRLRRPEPLVGVEALDPTLGVLLVTCHPVRGARVPVVHMAVDDEVLFSVFLVHVSSSGDQLGCVAVVSSKWL